MDWGSKVQSRESLNTGFDKTIQLNSYITTTPSSISAPTSAISISRTRVSEAPFDQAVESLISHHVINEDLLLITPSLIGKPMPSLNKEGVLALIDLLTKPMTITGRPNKNLKHQEYDPQPSFQATFSLIELCEYLEKKGKNQGLIEAIHFVGGAVPWILNGASHEKKELNYGYLEAFFSQLGFAIANLPHDLLQDFGKRPSDIDLRFIVPKAQDLNQFCEEVNNFIALKAGFQGKEGIIHAHGYSKWNTMIDYKGEEENKRRRANGAKEELVKKYSIVGFKTYSEDFGKNDFDLLFVKQLPSENLFIRDALRIPVKDLIDCLIKVKKSGKDALEKWIQEIREGKNIFKVVPESSYQEGGWQPMIDRLLGLCRIKDKQLEFNDWAALLSNFVRGKRSQSSDCEASLVRKLVENAAKEMHLFSFSIQEKLKELKDKDKIFSFLVGLSLKNIFANHHDQVDALEALFLQAYLSLKQYGDFSKVQDLWKEMHVEIPGKQGAKLKHADAGVFGGIHEAIESDAALIDPILNLLQVHAFCNLCSRNHSSDAFSATFLMHNQSPHIQLKINGQHILMPFDPINAFKMLQKQWAEATEAGKKHLEIITKMIGYPKSYGGGQSSVLGRNLDVLSHFDIREFFQLLEDTALMSEGEFSSINREMLFACQAQVDVAALELSTKLPSIFAKWLKESTDVVQSQAILTRIKENWNVSSASLSIFQKLHDERDKKHLPVHFLWTLALAKSAENASQGLAAYESWVAHCQDFHTEEFALLFMEELSKSRPDLAAKGLAVMEKSGFKSHQIKDVVVFLLKRKADAVNVNPLVVKMLANLIESNLVLSAEIVASISPGILSSKQEADIVLLVLNQCRETSQLEKIFPSIKSLCSSLLSSSRRQFTTTYSIKDSFGLFLRDAIARNDHQAIEECFLLISKFNWDDKGSDHLSGFLFEVIDQLIERDELKIAQEVWLSAFNADLFPFISSKNYQNLLRKLLEKGYFPEILDLVINSNRRFKKEQISFLLEIIQSDGYRKFLKKDSKIAVAKLKIILEKLIFLDPVHSIAEIGERFKKNTDNLSCLLIAILFTKISKPPDSLKSLIKAHSSQLLDVLVFEKCFDDLHPLLKGIWNHFSKSDLGKAFATSLYNLAQDAMEGLSLEAKLTVYQFSECVKKHLPHVYQNFLEHCYRGLEKTELIQPVQSVVLDLLMKMNCKSAVKWNGWLEKFHITNQRSLLKRAAEYLLSEDKILSENWTFDGNSRDVAKAIVAVVDAQQKGDSFACLELLEHLPRLCEFFKGEQQLKNAMLAKLFEGTDKAMNVERMKGLWEKQVQCAKNLVGWQIQENMSINSLQIIEDKGSSSSLVKTENLNFLNLQPSAFSSSKLTLEKFLEANFSPDEIIEASKHLEVKNVSVRELKNILLSFLKGDPEKNLQVLKALYQSQLHESHVNLMDAILNVVLETSDLDLNFWIQPILNRFKNVVGKKTELRMNLILNFNRVLNAACALSTDANGFFIKLLKQYSELAQEKQELNLDTAHGQLLLKIAKEFKLNALDSPQELASFAWMAQKLYQSESLGNLNTEEKQHFFLHLMELLMNQGLDNEAEKLIPVFLDLYDEEDPIWYDQVFCSKAEKWVGRWFQQACFSHVEAMMNPSHCSKLKYLFSFVCRFDLSSDLYIQVLNQMGLSTNVELAKHVWEEGWKQKIRPSSKQGINIAKRAKCFEALTSYASIHYPEGLYEIIGELNQWSEFIHADEIPFLARLKTINSLLPLILNSEIRCKTKSGDCSIKWKKFLSSTEDFFHKSLNNFETIHELNALKNSKNQFELFKVVFGLNFGSKELIRNDDQKLELYLSNDLTYTASQEICESVSQYLPQVPKEFQKIFVEKFLCVFIPKIKEMVSPLEDFPLSLDTLMRTYVKLLPSEKEVISFINFLRTEKNAVFEILAYNLAGDYLNYTNTGLSFDQAYENQMRFLEMMANSYIEILQEEAITEIREFHSQLSKEISHKELAHAFDSFFDNFITKLEDFPKNDIRFVNKDPIKQVFYVAYIINVICGPKDSVLRSQLVYKTVKSLQDLRVKLNQDKLQNNDIYALIPTIEVDGLEKSFFNLILSYHSPYWEIGKCREILNFMRMFSMRAQYVDSKEEAKQMLETSENVSVQMMLDKDFKRYLRQIADQLEVLLKEHLNKDTFSEVIDCLDHFIFFPFPLAFRIEGFNYTIKLMRQALASNVFGNDPLRFFQYTFLCPLKAFDPDDPAQKKLTKEDILMACENAVVLLLDNPHLSRIDEAARYIEIAGPDGVPPHLKSEGVMSGPIVDMKKKMEKMRKEAFLAHPQKYFELWLKVFQEYKKLTGENPSKVQHLSSMFESRLMFLMSCISKGVFNVNYSERLNLIDQQCEILKANPELFFEKYAPKMTLLYLIRNQERVLNATEKAAGLTSFQRWLNYLSESQHPDARSLFENAKQLLDSSKIFVP